jgi:hypothetical protein
MCQDFSATSLTPLPLILLTFALTLILTLAYAFTLTLAIALIRETVWDFSMNPNNSQKNKSR